MINEKTKIKISSDAIAQMLKVAQYLEKDHPVSSYNDVIIWVCDDFLGRR